MPIYPEEHVGLEIKGAS